jgi:endonuclease-3
MKRTDKATRIQRILDGLYPEQPIPLDHDSPFTLLVAVLMSAQTTDAQVKNIKRLAGLLVERHAGGVPDSLAELEALPGVGHKTASVVMCQAFGRPAFPVDTHIHRLAARWGLSRGTNVVHTERDLKKIFPEREWAKLHLQIIYFGREHCPAQRHDLRGCPICSWAATKRRIAMEMTGLRSRAVRSAAPPGRHKPRRG